MEVLQVLSELEPITALYKLTEPKRVLEIGCWDGGTMQVWLENATLGCSVFAVDLEHRNSDAYKDWQKPGTELSIYTGSSLEPDGWEFISANGPYDWVFIDGDHSAAGVRSDWHICAKNAAPGAVILLHDIKAPEPERNYPPGDLLNQLSLLHRVERFVDPEPMPWAHGIGVVQL